MKLSDQGLDGSLMTAFIYPLIGSSIFLMEATMADSHQSSFQEMHSLDPLNQLASALDLNLIN